MTNLMIRENFYSDLYEFRRDFDEIFNQMLAFKPFVREQLPFEKAFNLVPFVPAVEAYVDTEAKKYICRVSLPGVACNPVTTGGVVSTSKRSLSLPPVSASPGVCDGASDATTLMR